MGVLDVTRSGPRSDNSIIGYEYHSHAPYTTSFKANDEIRIPIQQQDIYTIPSESYLHVEFKVTNAANAALGGSPCVSGFFAHLWSEIRYEINGVIVDSIRTPGITSLMKNAMTFDVNEKNRMERAGYKFDPTVGFATFPPNGADTTIMDVPLRYLLGFAEDYKQILLNVKQELVLRRSADTTNCLNAAGKVVIEKITWRIPYVEVADEYKLRLLKLVQNDTPISMTFRHWELYEYPTLPATKKHTWTVKSTAQHEKPRYIVIGLQTARYGVATANSSQFDKCNMRDIRVFLNNKYYPYESIGGDDCCVYGMYEAFNGAYNHGHSQLVNPLFEKSALENGRMMLYAFDCSRQNESLKTGSIDVRIEFEATENIPADTRAYCLMIHDVTKEYKPMSGIVQSA